MKVDPRFPRQVVLTLIVVGGLSAYPLFRFASREILEATIAGTLLSTLNALGGFLAIEYSFDKSYTTFLKTVLGGMGIRMAVMLGGMAVLIKLFQFHVVALVVSMLGLYMVYLVLEILYIQKKLTIKN